MNEITGILHTGLTVSNAPIWITATRMPKVTSSR